MPISNKTTFLVTLGEQSETYFKLAEGHRFKAAKLLRIGTDQKIETLINYEGNKENYPDKYPNILFTAATLSNDKLYLCSETEVFVYSYPSLHLEKKASYPFFQNCHHVALIGGNIAVVSTGLDMIILLDGATLEPKSFYNALGKDPWHRFSSEVDYRKINSTKPHDSHPNYVFEIHDEVWITRFNQKDAICLTDPEKRIDIRCERVHDGHVVGDHVFFTCVNGFIVIANIHTLKVEEIVNLNEIEGAGRPLGWCRGLAIDENILYIGFSKLRATKIRENIRWLLNYTGVKQHFGTRIVAYDIVEKKKIGELKMPKGTTNVIYSIISEPPNNHLRGNQ